MKNLIAGVSALFVAFGAAQAAQQVVNFTTTITSGPNLGQTAASTLLIEDNGQTSGVLLVRPDDGTLLSLDFNIFGLPTATETDDVDFDTFPQFEIDLVTLTVLAANFLTSDITIFTLEGFFTDPMSGNAESFIIDDGNSSAVPVPAAALLFAPVLAGMAAARRTQK